VKKTIITISPYKNEKKKAEKKNIKKKKKYILGVQKSSELFL